jgi:glucokinase
MSMHISVDIGGTQLRAALFDSEQMAPRQLNRIRTHEGDTPPLERLRGLIASVWPEGETVEAIGVAAPGPTDPYRGVILKAPNIPGWKNLPLRQYLQDEFKTPVALGNDANLAALGEWQFGAGQGHHDLIYITISTGIGSGVIIKDQLLLGVHGLAGEVGHVTVQPEGPLCGCGKRGHLEAFASGPSIARWVKEEIANGVPSCLAEKKNLSAKDVTVAALENDALSLAAMARAGSYLGMAVADLLHLFNPEIVILGGGVAQSGMLLLEPMSASLKEHVISSQYLTDLSLKSATLGDEAGLYGALVLARSLATT